MSAPHVRVQENAVYAMVAEHIRCTATQMSVINVRLQMVEFVPFAKELDALVINDNKPYEKTFLCLLASIIIALV